MSVYPDVVFASGPTYLDGSTNKLIPFTYSNGRLDLPSSSGYSSGDADRLGNEGATVRKLGGVFQVTSIGSNLQAFIKSGTWDGYTISGTITVVSPGIVTRVQQLSSKFLAPTWDQKSYNVSPNRWDGANFIGEKTVFLFDKPLVVQATGTIAGGSPYSGPICLTFQTSWDH